MGAGLGRLEHGEERLDCGRSQHHLDLAVFRLAPRAALTGSENDVSVTTEKMKLASVGQTPSKDRRDTFAVHRVHPEGELARGPVPIRDGHPQVTQVHGVLGRALAVGPLANGAGRVGVLEDGGAVQVGHTQGGDGVQDFQEALSIPGDDGVSLVRGDADELEEVEPSMFGLDRRKLGILGEDDGTDRPVRAAGARRSRNVISNPKPLVWWTELSFPYSSEKPYVT